MGDNTNFFEFLSDGVSFKSYQAAKMRTAYLPLCGICGIDFNPLKSSITPFLSGDIKLDKNHYLTKPASIEDLRNDTRNFFIFIEGRGYLSFTTTEPTESFIEAGQLWQKLVKTYNNFGVELEATNFIPISAGNVELMKISVKNISDKAITFSPTAAVPIFARALANKHDHEHVTSLLNRLEQVLPGVTVIPTMLFNEEKHASNGKVYFVYGISDTQEYPIGSFPTVDSFCGETGSFQNPLAVSANLKPKKLSVQALQGKEAVGALRFKDETINPKETKNYFIVIGLALSQEESFSLLNKFNTLEKFEKSLSETKNYWREKISSIEFNSGNDEFDAWLRWVTLQPVLRRIFGCSFLPEHDYGKGGRGWRDIWQDLLSLILIEPNFVREKLINNFAGVRIDGSNATIIGSKPGEFIADRNDITRVWMDHGVWPLNTISLYINQTGDYEILFEENTYFKDRQLSRTYAKDTKWDVNKSNNLKDKKGKTYKGTIIEHLLVQNLVQFFNVGTHNITRLESADWNDGLDMAFERGESVAFMSFYAGNLLVLADLIEYLSVHKKVKSIKIAQEIKYLLDSLATKKINYNNASQKRKLLFDVYFKKVEPNLSGKKIQLKISDIVTDLRKKAIWAKEHINKNEKISLSQDQKKYVLFNGYYDNAGKRLEGKIKDNIYLSLTGQVFPIMNGIGTDKDVKEVVKSVEKYLFDKELGGYRLNTDFGLVHYLDLGRAFGFAYGNKENGAFFNHMVVMYAFALYKRGFVKEGNKVLKSIYTMSTQQEAKIYPGIPEYFDMEGRGRYHYLTGSASWFILTMLTQVYGVHGEMGDLIIEPKLTREDFAKSNILEVKLRFANKEITVSYDNEKLLDYGQYKISKVTLNGQSVKYEQLTPGKIKIKRSVITKAKDKIYFQVVL